MNADHLSDGGAGGFTGGTLATTEQRYDSQAITPAQSQDNLVLSSREQRKSVRFTLLGSAQ